MKQWTMSHSSRGFEVCLEEAPWWALAVQRSYELTLAAIGEPCCHTYKSGRRTIWGWLIDHLLPTWPRWTRRDGTDEWTTSLREEASCWQYRLLNNRLAHFSYPRTETVLRLPLTDAQAETVDAEFAADMNDIFPPSERAPQTSLIHPNSILTFSTIPAVVSGTGEQT